MTRGRNVGDLMNGKNVTWGFFEGGFANDDDLAGRVLEHVRDDRADREVAPEWLDDAHAYSQVSRFLTSEVRAFFDERTLVPDDHASPPPGLEGGAPATVAAFLEDLWRA